MLLDNKICYIIKLLHDNERAVGFRNHGSLFFAEKRRVLS